MGVVGGLGDYKVRKNIFLSGRLPEVVNNPAGGGLVLRFQEYIQDVTTSSTANTFKIQSYSLNAANTSLFPFLSQIAANYEQYEFEGVLFSFQTRSADALNSTNTALGSVMMATQYDSYDSTFVDKGEMLNYEYSCVEKPSNNLVHMIECDPHQSGVTTLYTLYDASPPEGADRRLYDLGKFSIATTGFQGTSVNIGELHVTYQVRLLKPKLYTTLGLTSDAYTFVNTINTLGNSYGNLTPAGTTLALTGGTATIINTGLVGNHTTTTLEFVPRPYRQYLRLEIFWVGDTAAAVVYPTVSVSYGSIVSQGVIPPSPTSSTNAGMFLGILKIPSTINQVLTFGTGGTLPTNAGTVSTLIIRVMEVNPITGAV